MDKIARYQQTVIEVLQEYQDQFKETSQNIQSQIIADEKNGHYQFLWLGWKAENHIFNVVIHLDIIGDKIWIQQDNTETGIANLLVQKGIPKSEIVLAYFPPAHRKLTEFAAA
jgi:hypothetical protein